MRAAVFVLCVCALVGEALANSPTPLERQFAGLRIAIREGENEKAKKLLEDGARIWGKLFTDKHGILDDMLLQTCGEAGNYELAKDLIIKHDADVEFKDRKGGTAYSFCEKRRDNDEARGDPAGCDPDLWLQLVEECLAAKEAGKTDLELGSKYASTAGLGKPRGGGSSEGEDGDTPEKQRERLAKYEAEKKAKASMTADDKEKEKQRKKKEMQERIAEKKRKKAEEAKKEL